MQFSNSAGLAPTTLSRHETNRRVHIVALATKTHKSMDEQIEKLAAAWYEQGLIIGLGIRDSLTAEAGTEKEASMQEILRARFGLKEAADGGGNNYGGIGDAKPKAAPATPSNDSDEKSESSDVVADNDPNLPASELAQGAVGETSNGNPEKEAAASSNPFADVIL